MRILIKNETGKIFDTTVIEQDTGWVIPVTRIEIEPFIADNGWNPAVTLTLPQHALHLVTDKVTVHAMEMASPAQMTKEQALAWYKNIQHGFVPDREACRDFLPVGAVAQQLWDDPVFVDGIKYGVLIALIQLFALTPGDLP